MTSLSAVHCLRIEAERQRQRDSEGLEPNDPPDATPTVGALGLYPARTKEVIVKYAVFIRDDESTEEFVGLARIDTEADDEPHARDRAVALLGEASGATFTAEDVALCAELAPTSAPAPPLSKRPGSTIRMRMF